MRISTVVVSVFAALVAAADETSSTKTTVTTADKTTTTTSVSSAQASIINCVDACKPGDVNCTSKCIAVPNPDASQVNATNQCVADCPQGNGTAADTQKYSDCVTGCIGQHFFSSGGTPAATGTAGSGGSGSGSGSGSTTGTAGSGKGSSSGTQTGSSAAATSTTSKAGSEVVRLGSSAVGLVGFLAAFFAL